MFPGKKTPFSFTLNLSKFLQARFNVFLFRFMPQYVSRLYLLLLGKIYYKFKKKQKIRIENTLDLIYKNRKSAKELKKLKKRTFRGIIAHYHEKLLVAYTHLPGILSFLKKNIKITGEDQLKAALAKGKGVILVTAHYGAVECLPGALAVRDYPVTMILRFQTQRLKDSLYKRSASQDLQLVDLEEGNVFSTAITALKEGRILITECDEFENWRTAKNRTVTFLGQEMEGDRTLEVLRRHSGAAVATALMHRDSMSKFNMKVNAIITEEDDRRSVSQEALKVLEAQMEKTPYQWYQWSGFGEHLALNAERKKAVKQKDFVASAPKDKVSL